MFLLTSEDVLTRHFQNLAAHFRQTSRSTDLTDDTAVTLPNEVPEDSRVLHWHMTDYVGTFHYSDGKPIDCNAAASSRVSGMIWPAYSTHAWTSAVIPSGRGNFGTTL